MRLSILLVLVVCTVQTFCHVTRLVCCLLLVLRAAFSAVSWCVRNHFAFSLPPFSLTRRIPLQKRGRLQDVQQFSRSLQFTKWRYELGLDKLRSLKDSPEPLTNYQDVGLRQNYSFACKTRNFTVESFSFVCF